ncbi:hypothetical protein FQN60_018733, partial [Etheostoma spectabile]
MTEYEEKLPFICSRDGKSGMQHCQDVPPFHNNGTTCSLAAHQYSSAVNGVVSTGAGASVNACVNWNIFYNVCRPGDHNPYMGAISFDNFAYSWITIFQVVTLEGWAEIMFLLWMLILEPSAAALLPILTDYLSVTDLSGLETIQEKLKRTVHSKLFDRLVMFALFLSIVTMAIEHNDQPQELTRVLQISNIVFTIIFLVELIMKLLALTWTYFMDLNKIFDFVIVIISLWEIISKADGRLSVLRVFRLLRFVRLLHFLPYLKRQLLVLKRTITEAATLCMLLLIMGMHLFGGKFFFETHHGDVIVERKNFDTLLWAMVTVFQILTQEDWNVVMYNAMATTSKWASIYFIVVVILGKHVLLNILVGIVVQSFQARV